MAHRLTDLSRKREDLTEVAKEEAGERFFPLTIFVGDEEVRKLGLTDVSVGDEKILVARVRVTSVNISNDEDFGRNHTVELNFIEGDTDEPSRSRSDADRAKAIFGGE